MYAAAGGASIASRRKQKRLQLYKRGVESGRLGESGLGTAGRGKIISKQTTGSKATGTLMTNKFARQHQHQHQQQHPHHQHHHHYYHHHHHHQHHHHHHQHQHQHQHVVPSSFAAQAPPPPPQSSQFHITGIDKQQLISRVEKYQLQQQQLQQQLAPVSPIQFPISPPPLSLESSGSVTCATSKPNSFPFPPPSILDLRISPTSTSDLQCQGAGKVAWQGCTRSSPLPLFPNLPHGCRGGDGYKTKQCEAHRRWMKRNRIRDASYCYGSSGEDDDDDISGSVNRRRAEVNAAVNTVLYAGLGATALGLVISFVGTGEKGFLSPELKLIGPSLLCAGLLCCLFRVLLCLCLCRCGECRWCLCKQSRNKKDKEKQKTGTRPSGPMQTASLLSPVPQQPATHSSCQVSSSSAKGHELLLSPAQLPE
ncbi:PREDICTED: uncharacterized protein LOC107072983 isoform X1 [Polistes dominula]|uniref:Uncharacterized protein LOC107072983 isoform X1 n=1 Tax=Polistes dominula TaxID=743375 RepID=A0ABM1J8P3_POLDO|nr:PREDICTED: uncharacterized protein LOC107072983 isoform X1 [Polistes dominula]